MVNKYFINEPINGEYCIIIHGRFYPFFDFESGLIGKASNNRTIGVKDNVITDIATGLEISNFQKYLNASKEDFTRLENIKNLCFEQWEKPVYNKWVKRGK
jgi:hypothetical protein